MDFQVRDNLVKLGRDWEDGSDIIGRSLFVIATAPNGRRWAHEHSFLSHEQRRDEEEGMTFWGHVESVEVDGEFVPICDLKVEYLRAKIEAAFIAGTKLDPARWSEIDPAYGSEAYAELDTMHYFRDREVMEAADAGEISPYQAARIMMG